MMYIDKTGKSPQLDWIKRADIVTQQLLKTASPTDRNTIIDANEHLWRELKQFLLDISYQKCWYSEAKDTYNHLHVDHFRPKKVALGLDKKDHGGYWWLAYNWHNYRVCGGAGNVKKKDKFPVRAHKAVDNNSNLEDELYYFLDPTVLEDTLKLTFSNNGDIMPIEKSGWDYDRAKYTIENLNLNLKSLKEARKVLWNKCVDLVAELQDLMTQNNENPSPFRRGQIAEKLSSLKELVKNESEFSATARACLRSTGLEWAIACAA